MTDTLRSSQHLSLPPLLAPLAPLSSWWNAHKPYLKCFEVAPTPSATATATAARRCLRDGREATYVPCPLSAIRCPLSVVRLTRWEQQLLDTCPVLIAAINE